MGWGGEDSGEDDRKVIVKAEYLSAHHSYHIQTKPTSSLPVLPPERISSRPNELPGRV